MVKIVYIFVLASALTVLGGPAQSDAASMPEPDPPSLTRESGGLRIAPPPALAPSTEWTLHKTADGSHPSGMEQQMVWLMNQARSDPPAEGEYLATEDDANVASARSFFSVDLDVLRSEFDSYEAKPPAAFDRRLYEAALAHSNYMIFADDQTHDGQADRIDAAGFDYKSYGLSVFAKSQDGLYAHCGFNIDWGYGDNGMQDGRGHRMNLMSLPSEKNYANVGIAVVAATETSNVGPYAVSADYCEADTSSANHFNTFIVGTVWDDMDGDNFYDSGEGMAGVTVTPDSGTYYAVTGDAGGYAIPVSSGTYQVTFSGGDLASEQTLAASVGSGSALLDLEAKSNRSIPTLGQWASLALAGILAAMGVFCARRFYA